MDILKNIEKDFSNSIHQNFDSIQQSLTELLSQVTVESKNGYQNLLNSNAWRKHYHKLTVEELFVMNLKDKEILAILNLSIYQSIAKNDYSILIDGVFTYTRLRFLNRTYLLGTNDWIAVESQITNDKELLSLLYSKTLALETDKYDYAYLLSQNLLRTILHNHNFKTESLKQYLEFIGNVSSKFDISFLKYLYSLITGKYQLCKTSFEQMEQLYGRCQWLTTGWYREANLNKRFPIFLLGLYQLKNFANTNFDLDIKNEFLKNVNQFRIENPNYEPKLFRQFDGELKFLNEVLTNNFASFYTNYKDKMNEIKNYR